MTQPQLRLLNEVQCPACTSGMVRMSRSRREYGIPAMSSVSSASMRPSRTPRRHEDRLGVLEQHGLVPAAALEAM